MFKRILCELKRPYWWVRSLFAKKGKKVPFPPNWILTTWGAHHSEQIWSMFSFDKMPKHDDRYEFNLGKSDPPVSLYLKENGLKNDSEDSLWSDVHEKTDNV